MFTRRTSGLLLHPTSLPGPFGIGDLGPAARRFIDFLHQSGQGCWQTLPLAPTGFGESPYSATSAFAGNPLLISLQDLVAAGDLSDTDLHPWHIKIERTDYQWAEDCRAHLLPRAAETFFRSADAARRERFEGFCRSQAFWLEDYAIFQSLRDHFERRSWTEWPARYRDREQAALDTFRQDNHQHIRLQHYLQFVFDEQWQRLKAYANQRGIRIFGDLPIFVAQDSSDTWGNRHLFLLGEDGQPPLVAGVPPDYFSRSGQRWGNPLFDWKAMAREDYQWWRRRMARNLSLFDLLRVDHFRGFSACWGIPSEAPDALAGSWLPAPGEELFQALKLDLGELPLVAEDLGIITDEVAALRDRWGLPGMKILQFAFDSDHGHPYLPHNHQANAVVYTGTHDNNTTLGWWQSLDHQARMRVGRLLGISCREMPRDLVRCALRSIASLAIIPLQDLLALPSEARMNRPGREGGNWTWRMAEDVLTEELAEWLRAETKKAGRTPNLMKT